MNILVLGGTQFVGRHIVEALLSGGHTVSIFTRGQTPDELPEDVERLRGDRDAGAEGVASLAGHTWDACVDVSGYFPRQVRPTAQMLRPSVGRYIYMSAVSVYGDPQRGPLDEGHSRVPPAGEDVTEITNATYGRLKAACENVVAGVFGERCTVLRPQIVAGPYDPLDRFSYWVRRAAQGGEMLAPGDGTDHLQVIDARDVGRFTRQVIEDDRSGCYNLSGPRLTWAEFMELLGAREIVWVPAEIIRAAGVTEFELPLFRTDGGPRSRLMHVSHERAVAAGLLLRDLADTVRATREWLGARDVAPALLPELERRLIGLARGAT